MTINTYLSIITLNINGQNAPIKRHRVAYWREKKKKEPVIWFLQDTYLRAKGTYKLKVRGWKKIFHMTGKDRNTGVVIFISNNIDFKTKAIKENKEGY